MAFVPTPEFRVLLKTLKWVPSAGTPFSEGRAAYARVGDVFGGESVAMAAVDDVTAPGAEIAIPVRIYRPHAVVATPPPAVVYSHGGGWVMGSRDSHDKVCRNIAAALGCIVLSVEYRLAPEHPLPAGPSDVITVLTWAHANAAALGIDPARIAVAGDSAGGGLSAVAAIAARDAALPLSAQVLIYPSVDNRGGDAYPQLYPSRTENRNIAPLTLESYEWMRSGFMRNFDEADWRISPLALASKQGLAPALLIIGDGDILRDEALAYARELSNAGVPVTLNEFRGIGHGFFEMPRIIPEARTALASLKTFLHARWGV